MTEHTTRAQVPERKVIQIAVARAGVPTEGHVNETVALLYALCNDGTIWIRVLGDPTRNWDLLPEIPYGEF